MPDWTFLKRLPAKALRHAALARRDPENFGRNLLQFFNPALFEQRLVDVLHALPMHVRHESEGDAPLRLNVLDSAWTRTGMTGGPNTVVNLAVRVARAGLPVRFVSTVATETLDPAWFKTHAASLLGSSPPDVEHASAGDPARPLRLTSNDVFLATHWVTAQQLKAVLPAMKRKRFFYMLQEFEAGFYPWSSNYARVVETYGMDFVPVVNESLLAEFLFAQPLGRLQDPALRSRALVFEPAVDDQLFYPPKEGRATPRRRLLFYARPTNARNMFGLGLLALRAAAEDPAFAGWEFVAIGGRGSLPDLKLGQGRRLLPAPWVDYAGYGGLLRGADLLLCPMISPHTSYPVLEMAATGGLAVTNTFATKTAERLAELSPNIVAAEPTVEGLAAALVDCARRINGGWVGEGRVTLPGRWDAVLDAVAARVCEAAPDL